MGGMRGREEEIREAMAILPFETAGGPQVEGQLAAYREELRNLRLEAQGLRGQIDVALRAMEARRLGREAGDRWLDLAEGSGDANPYSDGCPEALAWENGFHDALGAALLPAKEPQL